MKKVWIKTPLSADYVAGLVAGDLVFLSGIIYTARDKAHVLMRDQGPPVPLEGAAIYHCGPLIRNGKVLSAGPTTSGRLARYTDEILGRGVKAIIGKGGLPCEPFYGKAVYLAYPGGCGASAAKQLSMKCVHLEILGMAEAFWELLAYNLGPMIVAIDANGNDIYRDVRHSVQDRLKG